MTHSPVYYDGASYVTMVAHVQYENEIRIPEYADPEGSCLHGLLEYSLIPGNGVLYVHDLDDSTTYEVRTVEDWEGLDKSAVQDLLDAVDGSSDVQEPGEEYVRMWNTYMRTGDPEAALMKHKIGTVVRIDYGDGDERPEMADIAHKIEWNSWHVAGVDWTWTDEEVEAENYEVIYRAGENNE